MATLEATWYLRGKKVLHFAKKMNEKMQSWRAINKALTKEALTMFGSFPSPKSLNLSALKSFQNPSCCRSAIKCLKKSILIFPSTSGSPSTSFSSSTSTQAPPVLEKCNKMSGKIPFLYYNPTDGKPTLLFRGDDFALFLLHWGETCSWDLNSFFRENVVEETKEKFDECFLQILQILVNHLTLNKPENNPF